MIILGLSSDVIRHDSNICIVRDGEILFASPEERFSGLKHDPRPPLSALKYALEKFDLTIDDIDAVAVGTPKFKVFKGITDCGLWNLIRTMTPVILKNPGFMLNYLKERISDSGGGKNGFEWLPREKVSYISHHLAHGASAYRTSGFDKALCVTMDAAGANENGHPYSGYVFECRNGEMKELEPISRYCSPGCFYNTVTQALAFMPVGEDWKLMGLAAFGDPSSCFREMEQLSTEFKNGKWNVNRYSVESKLIDRPYLIRQTKLWNKISSLVDKYGDINVAASAQAVLEKNLVSYFTYLIEKNDSENIALAGGVFHNIKACMRLKEKFPEINFYVQPAAGDVGASMGAALELYHRMTGENIFPEMKSAALGAEFSENEIYAELVKFQEFVNWKKPDNIAAAVAEVLESGSVVGLFNGRAEWGPRALGQRSVIADPESAETRDLINTKLKDREWFMPFAPSVIEEDGPRYFKNYFYSPFMTHAFHATKEAKKDLAAAVHLDGTARPQIVRKNALPHYHSIISEFKKRTGKGGVLNTSFNRHGLPIVNKPEDAINHLLWGCIDKLAMGPYLVSRKKTVPFKNRINWRTDQLIGKWFPFDDKMLEIREKRQKMSEKFFAKKEC